MNRTRRFTLTAMLGAIAAGIGSKAFAQRHGHGPMDPADLDRHVERMLKHLYVEIDATDEQKQRLEPIVKQAAKELAPLRQNLHAARRQAIELLSQDRVDAAAVEGLRAQQIRLADDASRTLTRALVDAAEVLNPAQRKQLAAHFARRRGRWGHA
jgi:Spy/CpxP family protein refolding chaperone